MCCFSAKYAGLRRKSKDWLARNEDNASEWSDISIHGLLFQWAINIYFTCIVSLYRNDPTPHKIDRWLVFQTLYIACKGRVICKPSYWWKDDMNPRICYCTHQRSFDITWPNPGNNKLLKYTLHFKCYNNINISLSPNMKEQCVI